MTDRLGDRFLDLITRAKGGNYRTVQQLHDALSAPFSLSCPTTAVFAIVRDVTSDWVSVEKSKVKLVHLMDPLSKDPLPVTLWCHKGTVYQPASMLKIRGIQKSRRRDGTVHLKADGVNVTQFPIFKYDYEEDEPPDFFTEYEDRNICELLEQWFADRVTKTRLSDLSSIVQQDDRRVCYVNLVGQPWAKRYMECSLTISFTDGSVPSIRTKDPYNEEYAGLVDGVCADCQRKGFDQIDVQKLAHINIWSNESHKSNPSHHFETAHLHDLDSDWWLLFLNVEVRVNEARDEVELTLRSGHHRGKGIRTIAKDSVLGRMLLSRWEPVSSAEADATSDGAEVGDANPHIVRG